MRIRSSAAQIAAVVIIALICAVGLICIINLAGFSTLEYYAGLTRENANYIGFGNYPDVFKMIGAERLMQNDAALCALKILLSGAYVFLGAYRIGNIKNSFTRGAALSITAAPVFVPPALCVWACGIFFGHGADTAVAVVYDALKAGGLCIVAAVFFSGGEMPRKKALWASACCAAFVAARAVFHDINLSELMNEGGLLRGFQSWIVQLVRYEGNYGGASAMIVAAFAASVICCAGLAIVCIFSSKGKITFINLRRYKSRSGMAAGIAALLIFFAVIAAAVCFVQKTYEAIYEVNMTIHLMPSAAVEDIIFILLSTLGIVILGAVCGFGITHFGAAAAIPCAVMSVFCVPSFVVQIALRLTEHPYLYRLIIRLPNALTLGLALALICGRAKISFRAFLGRVFPILPFAAITALYFGAFNLVEQRLGMIENDGRICFAQMYYNFLRAGGRFDEAAAVLIAFMLLSCGCIMLGMYMDKGGRSADTQ